MVDVEEEAEMELEAANDTLGAEDEEEEGREKVLVERKSGFGTSDRDRRSR